MSEERITKLEAQVAELERVIAGFRAVFGGGGADAATDRELDQQWGDPAIAFVPRDWTSGGAVKGQKFSRCPAELLDMYAEAMDEFARRNDAKGAKDGKGRPKSYYDKKNARFARGWSRRLRSGWQPPPAPTFGANTSSGFGSSQGTRPFGTSGTFGAARAAPPAPPPSGNSVSDGADEGDEDFIDTGTDFPYGANVAPKDEEEEAPL